MDINQKMPPAIILCGGQGARIKSLLPVNTPKIMTQVCGKPFVDILDGYLLSQGITDIIYATGYGHEVLASYLQMSGRQRLFSRELEPLGTAGAVQAAIIKYGRRFGDNYFIINGDTYCELDYCHLVAEHKNGVATIVRDVRGVHAGVTIINVMTPTNLGGLKGKTLEDALDVMRQNNSLQIYMTDKPFYDIGTPEGLAALWARGI